MGYDLPPPGTGGRRTNGWTNGDHAVEDAHPTAAFDDVTPPDEDGSAPGDGVPGGPTPPSGAGDLHRFLDGIGRYRLLTPADEVELAKRVERGDRAARDALVVANLRLVVSIAKRYRIPAGSALTFQDLIQEGVLGLIRAAELYDWRAGTRFSTYGSIWIRQAIGRCLMMNGQTIRLSAGAYAKLRAAAQAEATLRERLGREPNETEVAAEAGVPGQLLNDLRRRVSTVSLDQAHEDGGAPLAEALPSDDDVAAEVEDTQRRFALARAVSELPARLRELIVLRYGMAGEEPRSLAEIGRHFGFTRERARQLERQALDQLTRQMSASWNGARERLRTERLTAFTPAALYGLVKSALGVGATQQVAAGVAVVATATAVAPIPQSLTPGWLQDLVPHPSALAHHDTSRAAPATARAPEARPPQAHATDGIVVQIRDDGTVAVSAAPLSARARHPDDDAPRALPLPQAVDAAPSPPPVAPPDAAPVSPATVQQAPVPAAASPAQTASSISATAAPPSAAVVAHENVSGGPPPAAPQAESEAAVAPEDAPPPAPELSEEPTDLASDPILGTVPEADPATGAVSEASPPPAAPGAAVPAPLLDPPAGAVAQPPGAADAAPPDPPPVPAPPAESVLPDGDAAGPGGHADDPAALPPPGMPGPPPPHAETCALLALEGGGALPVPDEPAAAPPPG